MVRTHLLRILVAATTLLALICCSPSGPEYTIGVSQCSSDEWREQTNSEIMRESLFYPQARIVIKSAEDNSSRQVHDIETFIRKGVDLLIVSPNEAEAVAPAIEKAFDAGIPVVLFDRKINSGKYTAYIGADNYAIGRMAGEYVAGRLQGKGNVIELTGLMGSTPAYDRHRGFTEAIARYPGLELIASTGAGWFQQSARATADSLLACHDDIDLIFAQNDRMAVGAYQAALDKGREKDMLFIGVDALAGDGLGVDMVTKGVLDASFIYPTGGDRIVQTAMAILQGEPYERETLLSTALVNSSNARIMQMQTSHILSLDNKIETLNRQLDVFLNRYRDQRIFLLLSVTVLAVIFALLVLVVRAFWNKKQLSDELGIKTMQLEKQKKELETQRDQVMDLSRQLEDASRAKIAFFTNVSHDFRTPLTLIIDPVEQLLSSDNMSEKERYLLKIIHKNVTVLLRLINQTLDFRKYENGKLSLDVCRFDISEKLREWAEAFRVVAFKKHIRFNITVADAPDGYMVTADAEKLERITYNILANAFKFTPENGQVSVTLSRASRGGAPCFHIDFSDSGIGLSAEEARHIFDNFYQVNVHHAGSGIGLALAKAFVEMHGGNISVESTQGKGTVFHIEIPAEQALPARQEAPARNIDLMNNLKEGAVISASQEDIYIQDGKDTDIDGQCVLVIDDNQDIREYVRSLLAPDYNVLEASNGKDGLRLAFKYVPDAIICDVMMPVMDGMEFCRRIKSEVQTSHIPVIMLTAYDMDDQKIKGYEYGADSYISKPFKSRLLLTRLKMLIENRRKLREHYGLTAGNSDRDPVKDLPGKVDKDFMDRFNRLLDSDLSASVEELGTRIGLSRVQLYRKLKALTGCSPNEYQRIRRLKRAASLLSSTDKTVSEVAFIVGFSSASYFARCYKEYFGENPTDFLKRKPK